MVGYSVVPATQRLRPRMHVVNQGMLACLVFLVPVFAVSYFLTVPGGPWRAILVTQFLSTALIVLVVVAYRRASIWVDINGITERGFFGMKTHFPVSEIGWIVCADTFDSSSATIVPQLFVCDHQGRQIVRMRGQFWTRDSMDIVIATLPVPHEMVEESLSTGELGRDYPGLLYWFERHPILAALCFTAVTAVGGGVYLLLELTGIAH